jgi:hypothetical protein
MGSESDDPRCSFATVVDAKKQRDKSYKKDCCRYRNRWLLIMRIIESAEAAILKFLLSEADFFVDEKDLQTFVGATSQSRFFLPPAC